ncbi:MAG: long-chain fatty acid--CoA ligase [Alphaproteobacteria bacterium]|nr:MAG: long-chain fatty acid--CoA ligase [Alphaproteobacteria bacterium]
MTDIMSLLEAHAERFGDKPALCNGPTGNTESISYRQLWHDVQRLAGHLMDQGVVPGDRVAILSESRAEWGVCFFAILHAGAIVVPMDAKMSQTEFESIIRDSSPKALFISKDFLDIAAPLRSNDSSIEHVFVMDKDYHGNDFPSIHQIQSTTPLPDRTPEPDELAVIFYTSGTMGSSKGVMITFGNLNFQMDSLGDIVAFTHKDRFLSILPLSHVLELTGGLLYLLSLGTTIIYARTILPQELLKLMQERKVTAMVAVPMFFQVLKNKIESEMRSKGKLAQVWFDTSIKLAQSIQSEKIRRLMFVPILRKFGGKLRIILSGGAPLDPQVEQFFNLIGINLLQGYGLTETSPTISVNVPHAQRGGSVGKPLKGVEVRIDAKDGELEGEILTRGPHVMKGYYKLDNLTKTTVDEEGWLRTGDLGHLDEDGYLYITGRAKNLIVLSNGLKVQPEEVEEVLLRASTIQEVCVCAPAQNTARAQRTSEICAVVTPTESLLELAEFNLEKLRLAVETEIAQLAQSLAPHKRPKRVLIYDGELPKTTTKKVKRLIIHEWLDNGETNKNNSDATEAVAGDREPAPAKTQTTNPDLADG